MRINKADNILQVYQANNTNAKKANGNNTIKKNDNIKISEKAIDVQYGLQKLKEVDNKNDIRFDKVEDLKRQIQAGTYNVSGEAIAEKILAKTNFNELV